jgi:hypothetical protein
VDSALIIASVGLVFVTAGLVYATWRLVAEARETRREMELTRGEAEEARRLGVRPHLTLEPKMMGPVYASLSVRNLGPGAARNVKLLVEFEPLGDVRELTTPVILAGHSETFILPDSINDLDGAQAANLVSKVTGEMYDVYGQRFPVELVFDWAPWVEKLTDARRLHVEDAQRDLMKHLEAIKKEIESFRRAFERRDRS